MKILGRVLLLVHVFISGAQGTSLLESEGNLIRVRLGTATTSLTVEGKSVELYRWVGPFLELMGREGDSRWNISRVRRAGKWSWILQSSNQVYLWSGDRVEIRGRELQVNQVPSPDRVALLPVQGPVPGPAQSSGIDIVGHLGLEDYLIGVLPAEMPAGWPMAALKAQAIAARTYALFRRTMRADKPWDLEATVSDQVFRPHELSRLPAALSQKVRSAVLETRGMILKDKSGQLVAAHFHADCGGRTEPANTHWTGFTSRSGTLDRGCPLSPLGSWSLKWTLKDVLARLKARRDPTALSLDKSDPLVDLAVLSRSPTGRVNDIEFKSKSGRRWTATGEEFRSRMGVTDLRSTRFDLLVEKDTVTFTGTGFGHGVGLCQWGTKYWAEKGWGPGKILSHYFPQGRIHGGPPQPTASSLQLVGEPLKAPQGIRPSHAEMKDSGRL